ncbi:MAG: hypothetical protein J0H15_06930 [Xanthomonadales bacterium]|nr:hypothetical protein [Xanthomonadales bacterium]
MRLLLAAGITLALSGTAAASGTFVELQTPNLQITRISPNGAYATGAADYMGVRWTAGTGTEEVLPALNGAMGINDSGTIGGTVPENGGAQEGGRDHAAYAAIGQAPVQLTDKLSTNSSAYDISSDGTMVGLSFDDDFVGVAQAFMWTAKDGMIALPVNRPANASRANAISADGSVIGGWNDQDFGDRTGVLWVAGEPMDIEDADGNPVGEVSAVSIDGRFAVGSNYVDSDFNMGSWRWSAQDGVTLIPGMTFAFAVSADGRTVVGSTGFFDIPPRAPMIWREGVGTVTLPEFLDEQGIAIPDGWGDLVGGLTAMSADGYTLGGWAFGDTALQSYIIKLDAPDGIFQNGFELPPVR